MNHSPFTKSELDLLLKSARSRRPAAEASSPAPNPEPFDFRGLNRLSPNHIAKLLELHTDFAKRLGQAMSNLLGAECKTTPKSVELMTYGALGEQSPEGALFETLRIRAPEGNVVLQADLATVLPMIDLMIGGTGAAAETIRPLTEIEREIFKPVIGLVAAELQASWAPFLETSLRYEHCGASANLLPANERVSSVKFEIQVGELSGTWTLVLPMLVSNALTRKLEQQESRAESEGSDQNKQRLKERLLESNFLVELFLPPSGLSVRKLAHLKVGQVLLLKTRSTEPIQLNIAGMNLFQAAPVSCGPSRGAQIKKTLSMVKTREKEAR